MQLNSLVKAIEFYKLQNGTYPESLEQLKATDATVLINDPLLAFDKDKSGKTAFEYKKIGEIYTVFSVGMDKRAGTSDDISPNLKIPVASKIGFLRK
jgi:hypothetical protein